MKISDETLHEICKIGQGIKTCRYIGVGNGWKCLKLTELKCQIDKRVKANTFTAQGDNCEGKLC